MIPYSRQIIDEHDIEAIVKVLRSDFLTQGPAVPGFETAVAERCGSEYAVALNSATSALHVACLSLGVGAGDIVWTSPITFVATANCALFCGAEIDFVDIAPDTYNIDVNRLAEKLEEAERNGRLPKVVIPVHMCGRSCDMHAIAALANRYGFRIIEDASHAVGAEYGGEFVGSCRHSDIVVFSFHPVKIITSGEGGMALTNSRDLASRMRLLRSHGITRIEAEMTKASDGPWYYEQVALGFNYRMTDIQAALGESQLMRLSEFVGRRRTLAKRYRELLGGAKIYLPSPGGDEESAWHLFVIRVDHRLRHGIFRILRAEGIQANVHYIPVHLQPYYRRLGFVEGQYPEAEQYYREAITLPLYPGLQDADQEKIAAIVRKAVEARQ